MAKKATPKKPAKKPAATRRGSPATSRRAKVSPGDPISQRAYADSRRARNLVGKSHAAVRKAITTGRLKDSLVRHGKSFRIIPDLADLEWDAKTDPNQQRESPEDQPPVGAQGGLFDDEETKNRRASATSNIAVHRAAREEQLARKTAIEVGVLEGSIADYTTTYEEVFNILRGVRDRIFALKPKLSATFAGETERHKIGLIMDKEFNAAFTEVSDELHKRASAEKR